MDALTDICKIAARADARIAELETAIIVRDTEIARLETDLELAIGQAAAMVERMRESIRRALYAWDTSTYSKGHDGHFWQTMEELRQEIGSGESGDAV